MKTHEQSTTKFVKCLILDDSILDRWFQKKQIDVIILLVAHQLIRCVNAWSGQVG